MVLLLTLVGAVVRSLQASTITLQSSAPSAVLGQVVTLTAAVTPASATGKVTFYDGSAILGIAKLSSAQATLSTSLLSAGAHSLRAYYPGDSTNTARMSSAVSQMIAANVQVGFRPAVTYSVGAGTGSVVLADFNGDNRVDAAVVNNLAGTVSILLGNADGTFTAATPPTYTAGNGAGAVVVSDLDGDGNADIIVANSNDASLSILLGKGDGTFQPAVRYSTNVANGGPSGLKVADVNGDGIPDVLVGEGNSNVVTLFLGNGNGAFQAPRQITVGNQPGDISVADINGDGLADLITGNYGDNTLTVMLGNGNGTFRAAPNLAINNPQQITVADLNGDGFADLAVPSFDINTGIGSVYVFLGKGDGTFQQPTSYPVGLYAGNLVIGDVNGDGKLDLIVSNDGTSASNSSVSVLLGNGNGSFQSAVNYAVPHAQGAVIADFNKDGVSDLMVTDYDDGKVYVLLGVPPLPDMTISLMHTGALAQGQSGVSYTITVTNVGPVASTSPVTVGENPPSGLTITGMSGTGWTCTLSTLSCTRSDSLAASASYPAISVTASVANNAQGTVVNSVSVSGGGETNVSNDVANDSGSVAASSLVYAGSGAAPPNGAANFPLVLSLPSGVNLTAMMVTVQITPVSGAPALTGSLAFTPGSGQPTPSTSAVTASTITLTYSALTPALTGFVNLGSIALLIPSTATQGQSYTVNVSLGSVTASGGVSAGLNAALFAASTYLVGDVSPYSGDVGGTFGDGKLGTLDLVVALRATTGLSGFTPPACSDRFDAMDTSPVDSTGTRGGDGQLNTLDLIVTLKRVTGLDTSQPTRTVRGNSCAVRQLQAVPAPRRFDGYLETVPSGDRTAVYLHADRDLALSGLAFSVAAGTSSTADTGNDTDNPEAQPSLTFQAESGPPSLADSGVPGKLVLAWLSDWQVRAGDHILLGYVSGSAALRFVGISANAVDGQDVFLSPGLDRPRVRWTAPPAPR
jgi:uncharacterized repeat protein (TIGR01451 family)